MKCYSFVHESLAEPVSIAMYLLSLALLCTLFYYLVLLPLKTAGVSTQKKIIMVSLFLIIFVVILLGLPNLREYWLYWVEWCMEVSSPIQQGAVMNITP